LDKNKEQYFFLFLKLDKLTIFISASGK